MDLTLLVPLFASDADKLNSDLIVWCKMSLLRCKYLNELFETQDFSPSTQKDQRLTTCHHLHMAALTPIRSMAGLV